MSSLSCFKVAISFASSSPRATSRSWRRAEFVREQRRTEIVSQEVGLDLVDTLEQRAKRGQTPLHLRAPLIGFVHQNLRIERDGIVSG